MAAVGILKLCPPALFYLILSFISLIVMSIQNTAGRSIYCLGQYSCDVPSVTFIFLIKIMYVLFWTWILNIICRLGYSSISWFLVFIPFILMFVIIIFTFFYDFSYRDIKNRIFGYFNSPSFLNSPLGIFNSTINWLYN